MSENNVVAKINNEPIYDNEVQEILSLTVKQYPSLNEKQLKEFKQNFYKQALEQLIDLKIIQNEIKNNNIEVSDAEFDSEMNLIKQQFGDDKKIDETLKKINMTKQQLIDEIKQKISINKLFSNKTEHITEPDKDFFNNNKQMFIKQDEIRASHILISSDNNNEAETKNKIQEIFEHINNNILFNKLAQDYSDCPSKSNGGDLGFFSKGKMVPEFEKAAFDLEVNEISKPVKTQFGHHIIKVTDKKESENLTFEEAVKTMKNKLINAEKKVYFDNWISEQKKNKVEYCF